MKELTPIQAIRKKCLDCVCGNRTEVRICNLSKCPLHPFRMGVRPEVDKYIDKKK